MYRYRYFGTLRFFLAVLVMFQHFAANAAPEAFSVLVQGYEVGSVAVLVFFVMSGFVIAEAVDTVYRDRPVDFIRNRLLRVFPHFLIAMVLLILLHAVLMHAGILKVVRDTPPPSASIFAVKNILFNMIGIVPFSDHFMSYKFIAILWAVRTEMVFYLVIFACLLAISLPFFSVKKNLGLALAVAVMVLTPLFCLAVLGDAPGMLGFVPYFAFGAAWFFALQAYKAAKIVAGLSVPALIWQFLSLPAYHPTLGFPRHVDAQLSLLLCLIAATAFLATAKWQKFRATDRMLGTITYPLYMYHYGVLITVESLFPDNGYWPFLAGMAVSIFLAYAMSRVVDPLVDTFRDKVRGRRLPDQPASLSNNSA